MKASPGADGTGEGSFFMRNLCGSCLLKFNLSFKTIDGSMKMLQHQGAILILLSCTE